MYDPTGLQNDCQAWWRLHEGSGYDRDDSSGNGNTLVEHSGTVSSAAGLISNAAFFAGVVELYTPGGPVFSAAPFSVSLWFNAPDVVGIHYLLNQLGGGLNVNTNAAALEYNLDGVHTRSVASVVVAGQWVHVVLTSDGTTSTLYVNGVEVFTVAEIPFFGTVTNLQVGLISVLLEELIGVWSRVLTPAHVGALYNGGNAAATQAALLAANPGV